MIIFSFNNSRLVTVWDAAHSPTLKWYVALAGNEQVLRAAWLSIRIALVASTGAVILGTLAGVALARFGAFRGRLLLAGMTTAPIVMPEVITGLSLLLLFVALQQLIGWPRGVGAVTITLSHITFCMAYVTVVVQSRLAGMDVSLEEAAMDLGARPGRVFFRITLPLILPAIASGWLLAFTLSWDDLVITQFVAGPGFEHAADGHFFQGALRRDARHQCARDHPGADGGDRDRRLHGVDALPAAPARARRAARRGRQPVNASVATRLVLGIDVGGSSIKAGLVDVASGRVAGQLIAAPTPVPSARRRVTQVIGALAAQLPGSAGTRRRGLPVRHQGRHRLHGRQHRSLLDRDRWRRARRAGARPAGAVPE